LTVIQTHPHLNNVSDNTASSPKPVAMLHDGITSYQPMLLVCPDNWRF